MEEEKKVIYRFDVDFKGTARTAPVINLASTDVNSRMFVMTPKSGADTLKLDADVSSLMVISYTSNGIKKIVGTLSCEYVNGKFVSDIPAFKNNNITDYDGSLILYRSNGGAESELSYKLESAPFKLQIVSSGATPGTVTAADEFKALTEATATAEFYNKVWDDSNNDADKITVSISNRDFINHKVIWVNPKAGKTAATKSGALTLYFSDGSSAEIKIVEPNGSFSSTVPLKRIRNGQLLCLWLNSPSTAIWINAIEDNLVVRTSSDSFDANNQLKIDKGLKVLSNGSVTSLDDALIPYPGAISGNTITFTPPSGYNADGIFAVKLSDGTNAGGNIKAKATGSSVEFTVSAYVGTKAITNFTAGVINADIPMLFVLKGRELIWMNYDSSVLPTETTLPDVLEVGKHYKISATSAITLKLPDTANDGDVIEVEYFNSGTASIRVQWCTVSSANTPTQAPILSNNFGTGQYVNCTVGTLHRARCEWSALAGKWTVDIELFKIASK